jgi:RNA polymerase sigma factor (sigma-70 family)
MPHISYIPLPLPEFLALLDAARGGDRKAVDSLVERYYPHVEETVHRDLSRDLRYSRPWLTARFSTGDVVQDVFRSLLADLQKFEGKTEQAFCGYLAMIIRNRLLDAIRFHEAAQRDGRLSADLAAQPDPWDAAAGPATSIADAESADRLEQAIATLEERERLLLRARIEQETQFVVLAERLGYSSKWAARRAFYAAQSKVLVHLGKSNAEVADHDS